MKLLSRLFRRPKATLKDGIALIDEAVTLTIRGGLRGFVFAVLNEPGSPDAEMVVAANGDIEQGLFQVLKHLLAKPESKEAVADAMVMALMGSDKAQVVQMTPVSGGDYCNCPICTLRRQVDEKSKPAGKPH